MEYELEDILKILEDNLSDYHKEVVNDYITSLLVKIEGNNEEINLRLEPFNDKEYILADDCIKAIGIHRKTNSKLHEEIERLNNIISNMEEELMLLYLDFVEFNVDEAKEEIRKLKGSDKE